MLKLKTFPKKIIAAAIPALFWSSHALADGMIDLGGLGGVGSAAYDISGDGSLIVGKLTNVGNVHAMSLAISSMVVNDLGTLGGTYSYASGVSSDGSVIVGYSQPTGPANNGYRAFKYVGSTMTDLGTLGGDYSLAFGVSSDGLVIVGSAELSINNNITEDHAFKYVGSTMTDLGTLGGHYSRAFDVSDDGSVIVGYSSITGDLLYHAFKYTGSSMTDLGTLGGDNSYAYGVSGDGNVIVGTSDITGDSASRAFKYVGTTMTDLGTLGGTNSFANAVSRYGSVIVGDSDITGDSAYHAFKYVGTTMTDLGTLGGTKSSATGVSDDGSLIVGESQITGDSAWHAFIYRNTMIDIDNTYLALAKNSYQLNSVLNNQSNLLNMGLNHDCTVYGANNLCVSVGGAYNNVNHSSASQTSASLTVGYQINPNVHIGAFLDQSAYNSMPSNYDLKNDMPLIGAFASWTQNTDGTGAKIKGSLAYSKRDLDITRSTLSNTEAGKGSSEITSKAAQVEGAWGIALNDNWISEPFTGVRVSQVSRDSYQEHNVDFPISYNKVNQTATTAYVGARLIGQVTPSVSTRLSAGIESDIHQQISDHTGTIDVLGGYSIKAPNMLHTRGFVNGSVNYVISPTQSLNAFVGVNQNSLNHAIGTTAMATYTIGF